MVHDCDWPKLCDVTCIENWGEARISKKKTVDSDKHVMPRYLGKFSTYNLSFGNGKGYELNVLWVKHRI